MIMLAKRPGIFLDRDGVLNRARIVNGRPHPPFGLDDLEVLPGVHKTLTQLAKAEFALIVVTNQPDVARGITTKDEVDRINQALVDSLPLTSVRVCFHDSTDGCECRKPLPGMILSAAEDFNIDLTSSFMVGDRWSDIEAGKRAGVKTVYVYYGYSEKPASGETIKVASLEDALPLFLEGIHLC